MTAGKKLHEIQCEIKGSIGAEWTRLGHLKGVEVEIGFVNSTRGRPLLGQFCVSQ